MPAIGYLSPMPRKPKLPSVLPEWVSLPEAAALANVSERHMRLLVNAGTVMATKVGRNWIVSRVSAVGFQRHPTLGRPRGTGEKT